jgi:two-component system response regulator FixJ
MSPLVDGRESHAPAGDQQKASAMSSSREKPMIAVVDDDRAVAKGMLRLLQASGLNVVTFTSGAAFLESLTTAIPDCIVLDLVMPEPDGFAVQARLKAVGVTAPVIVLSGSQVVEHQRRALAAGAFAFLEKAVEGEVLLEVIASALRLAQLSPPPPQQ